MCWVRILRLRGFCWEEEKLVTVMVKKKSAEKSDGGGDGSLGSVAPFLKKCYEMVDDQATDSIISWSDNDDCFIIWDMTQFSVELLPKYFKHNNFSSFMRQLNIYVSFPFASCSFIVVPCLSSFFFFG